jgi:hypothetical protein
MARPVFRCVCAVGSMILSGSINLFDGAELLPALLEVLRSELDHISVVYQLHSNYGNRADPEHTAALTELARRGWVDDVLYYHPEHARGPAVRHETRKRTLGLHLARRAGATHFITLDVDEFYRAAELRQAKHEVELNGFDVTACRVQNYHCRPTYRCVGLDRYVGLDLHVPLIHEIGEHRAFDPSVEYFCCVDQTRRMRYAKPYRFPAEVIVMHHMTTVRRSWQSLVEKFTNSSSPSPFITPTELANLVWAFKPGPASRPSVDVVLDEFRIEACFRHYPTNIKEQRKPTLNHYLTEGER